MPPKTESDSELVSYSKKIYHWNGTFHHPAAHMDLEKAARRTLQLPAKRMEHAGHE